MAQWGLETSLSSMATMPWQCSALGSCLPLKTESWSSTSFCVSGKKCGVERRRYIWGFTHDETGNKNKKHSTNAQVTSLLQQATTPTGVEMNGNLEWNGVTGKACTRAVAPLLVEAEPPGILGNRRASLMMQC